MALVTGGADNLGCFLKGVGLDPERVLRAARRRASRHLQGARAAAAAEAPGLSTGTAGNCTTDNPNCVWNSKANLEAYDIVLLACEGDTFDPAESNNGTTNKTTSSKQALHDWLDEGGKVFATHFHYTWFKNGPRPTSRASRPGSATRAGRTTGSTASTRASRRAWSSTSGSASSAR